MGNKNKYFVSEKKYQKNRTIELEKFNQAIIQF